MDLETLPVVMFITGMILLYGAITNRNPVDVVQLALQGKDISAAAPISTAGINTDAPGPGAVDGRTLPGTPGADGDARTDPPGFDPNRDDVLPNYGGAPGNPNAGAVVYRTPFTYHNFA